MERSKHTGFRTPIRTAGHDLRSDPSDAGVADLICGGCLGMHAGARGLHGLGVTALAEQQASETVVTVRNLARVKICAG